jgi:uncharacterized membrane protein
MAPPIETSSQVAAARQAYQRYLTGLTARRPMAAVGTACDRACMAASLLDVSTDDGVPDAAWKPAGHIVAISRPRAELYAFWRNFTNLSRFMRHIRSVTMIDVVRSHWLLEGPDHVRLEWEAIIVEDDPDRLIAWTSTDASPMRNSGRVEFRDSPLGDTTEVAATILYDPPPGRRKHLLSKRLQRELNARTKPDLLQFRALMEDVPRHPG